jgi:replicative DNA helicase
VSLGKSFMTALLAGTKASSLVNYGDIAHLFKGNEEAVYAYVHGFVHKYGTLPTADTIELHTGQMLSPATEPPGYYYDLMLTRHTEIELKKTMTTAVEQLQPNAAGAHAAMTTITDTILKLTTQQFGVHISDLRMAHDRLYDTYAQQVTGGNDRALMLGWPTLDEMTGGCVLGDMISYVGRPGIGKTFQMLYGAHHGWMEAELDPENIHGSSRLFVSMEMDIVPIQQRLAAMHLHLPMDNVKKSSMSTTMLKTYKKGLLELQGYKAPFWVVDGNLTATVEQIAMLAAQLKPDAVFIDGAYLLKHPTEKDRYKRVAENADLIKKTIAGNIGPTVCSWQFKRQEKKKSKEKGAKDDEVTLDDIAYADAIGQVSSLVLGLFEAETVETLKQRRVRILKGRYGETGEFSTYWDFKKMNFGEVVPIKLAELHVD